MGIKEFYINTHLHIKWFRNGIHTHQGELIINLFAIFSYQIADIYHAMTGHQKNTKFN